MTSIFGIIFTFIILGSVLLFNLIYTNINWFIKFVSKYSFFGFGIYRILLGMIVLIFLNNSDDYRHK